MNTHRVSLLLLSLTVSLVILFQSLAASASPLAAVAAVPTERQTDVFETSAGRLKITPLYHATFLIEFEGKAIYFDPVSAANYDGLPKADLIFITDIHGDHMDPATVARLSKESTIVVAPAAVAQTIKGATVIANGQTQKIMGIKVQAIPMYNLKRGPQPGSLFHTKGRGNGYVITLANKRIYVSGDTECTPEMKALKNIDIAFVCMNLPYTMPVEEAADCVRDFRPRVVYPYHYRGQDIAHFRELLSGESGIEVRLREWYRSK